MFLCPVSKREEKITCSVLWDCLKSHTMVSFCHVKRSDSENYPDFFVKKI